MVRAARVGCVRVLVCCVRFLRELVFRVEEGAKERGNCGGLAGQFRLRFRLLPMDCLADPGFRVADFDLRLVDHCLGFEGEVRRLG